MVNFIPIVRYITNYWLLGGKTIFNWRLKEIKNMKKGSKYRYCLVFVETETCPKLHTTKDRYDSLDENEDDYACRVRKKKYVLCNKVILAMPRKSIELIEWHGFSGEKQQYLIESVFIQPSNKLLLGYEQPWWRAQNIIAGRSVSDTPLRQTVS